MTFISELDGYFHLWLGEGIKSLPGPLLPEKKLNAVYFMGELRKTRLSERLKRGGEEECQKK